MDQLLDPVVGSPARGRSVLGAICLHVENLFMSGGKEFEEKVLQRLRSDFTIGSEERDDVVFVGQRIRWVQTPTHGWFIQVDQCYTLHIAAPLG